MFENSMFIIELHRFEIQPLSKRIHLNHKDVDYKDILYKTTVCEGNNTTYDKMLNYCKSFLKDHYGYTTIYQDGTQRARLSNHKKFFKTFKKQSIQVHREYAHA